MLRLRQTDLTRESVTDIFSSVTVFFFFVSFLRDYSDSGEELSDDDIEIDYDDDDEDEDEDVEKVAKPLPPVARTVYKKNDWIPLSSHLPT